MMRVVVVTALVALGLLQVARAQSLGDVARKEEERRKAVKSSGKVYTNDTLRPEPLPSPPPLSTSTAPASSSESMPASTPSAPAPAPEAAPPADRTDEAGWKKRMADARDGLARSQALADALQTQVNSLTTDFVNRDDPAQRSTIAANRDKAIAELDRMKKEVATQTKAISDVQDEARKAGVPAGWVR
jgi:hypothetical protein